MENTGWLCSSVMERPRVGMRWGLRGRSGRRQQGIEAAGAIERGEVVIAADVALAYVDLRHGAPTGALHHLLAARGLEVDAHLLDLRDPLGLEQALGHQAVGTGTGRVHGHAGHGVTSPGAGSPAPTPRCRP